MRSSNYANSRSNIHAPSSSSSAVSQFEAWSREDSQLRAAAARADHDRTQLEQRLAQHRARQMQLSAATRHASDTLGRFHRDRNLTERRRERLQEQRQEERRLLEECSGDSDTLVEQEAERKRAYCREMEALNEELSDLLIQQEDRRLQKMVHAQSLVVLRECFVQNQYSEASLEDLDTAIDVWTAANKENEQNVKEREELLTTIKELRVKALKQTQTSTSGQSQALTAESLQQLERVWVEQTDDDESSQKQRDPAHVQLFYAEAPAAES